MVENTDNKVRLKMGPEESGLVRRSLESVIILDTEVCMIKPLTF